MEDKLRAAFDSVHAEAELKERTLAFLADAGGASPARHRPAARLRRAIAAAAACLLVLLGAGGYYALLVPVSAISVDVNPSLELSLNRLDRVISVEAFNLLHVPLERLRPSKPFSGVGGGSSSPLGQIRLPVTFGTRDNYRTELIDFDITRIGLPYNAILGYPALAQFMAATHPAYNLMKMPGSKDVLTIVGDTKEALAALKCALKTAAAARPANEVTLGVKEAVPTKKK